MLVVFGRSISFDISRSLTFPHSVPFTHQICSYLLMVFVHGTGRLGVGVGGVSLDSLNSQ